MVPNEIDQRRKRLPIGIQTFATLRNDGCYYVDKTPQIEKLLSRGSRYFLSRPRRFGKSLLLDTMKELFEGNEPLFRGLHIHNRWEWGQRHPVLRLSFGSGHFAEPGAVRSEVMAQLEDIAEESGVVLRHDTAAARMRHLIRALHRKADERVVVLVDEYDKPMLDALGEPEVARANRDYLRGLYATIKDCDAHVRFAFLTGVSKFSKVSVFSGLNNLQDITLDEDFADICGYTDADLDAVFAPELGRLDRDEVRLWYNGYNWLGDGRIYNPFDILLLFQTRKFRAHWFETGTPTFLVETLAARNVGAFALDGTLAEESLLSAFDLDRLEPEALLFQTGYLTIRDVERRGRRTRYRLGYPNLEVRQSLNESLLDHLVGASERRRHGDRLYDLLEANDFEGMEALFTAFLASIPYNWHVRNDIADYEGNEVRQDFAYASVFYSYFASQPDMQVTVEDATSHGRVDMAVLFNGAAYVFEFKVVAGDAEGRAMAQLRAKDYARKYGRPGRPVHLIGVEFSKETRNVVAFEVESETAT